MPVRAAAAGLAFFPADAERWAAGDVGVKMYRLDCLVRSSGCGEDAPRQEIRGGRGPSLGLASFHSDAPESLVTDKYGVLACLSSTTILPFESRSIPRVRSIDLAVRR